MGQTCKALNIALRVQHFGHRDRSLGAPQFGRRHDQRFVPEKGAGTLTRLGDAWIAVEVTGVEVMAFPGIRV